MIQAHHCIKAAFNLEHQCIGVHRPLGDTLGELSVEQLHQQHGDRGVFGNHLLDVVLAKCGADLAHVARVGTDQGSLLPAQAGAHDQRIEVIDLALPCPGCAEAVLEALGKARFSGDLASGERQTEVEDPCFLPISATNLVRVFVEDFDAHTLQDRQQARQ